MSVYFCFIFLMATISLLGLTASKTTPKVPSPRVFFILYFYIQTLYWEVGSRQDCLINLVIIYFTHMQKLIQNSLRKTVADEISHLNHAASDFHAMTRKLKDYDTQTVESAIPRLDSMRLDIKDKIRTLAANLDLLYQVIDKKISILVAQIKSMPAHEQQLLDTIREADSRIKDLEVRIEEEKGRANLLMTQNQQLKSKNIDLLQEIESLSKRRAYNNTNDTASKTGASRDHGPDYSENSIENPVSPLARKPYDYTDMTFNQPKANNIHKKIKSEQNSFSSMLIKEQNSFEPSYGSAKEETNFRFGCMPIKRNSVLDGSESSRQIGSGNGNDQGHRLSFLLSNLRSTEEKGKSLSSEYDFDKHSSEHETSVLSQKMVKKYHI